MSVTRHGKIREWLVRKGFSGVTHMLVVFDTFDNDYPVYTRHDVSVDPPKDREGIYEGDIKKIVRLFSQNMQRVMEVYSYSRDFESQIYETRAWHLDCD